MIKQIIFAFACVTTALANHPQKMGSAMVDTAIVAMKDGMPVIDVRQEACNGYVTGAHLISVDDIVSNDPAAMEKIRELTKNDKNNPLVIYCASGKRAQKAVDALAAQGYTNLHNIGGIGDYYSPTVMSKCE